MSADVAVFERVDLGVVELTGRDRVRFLHNLCTSDIYKLATGKDGVTFGKGKVDLAKTPAGPGCFTTAVNRQGKMIAAFQVGLLEDRIVLVVDKASVATLVDHFRKSAIMDDVKIEDRDGHRVFHLFGPKVMKAYANAQDVPNWHWYRDDTVLVSAVNVMSRGFMIVAGAGDAEQYELLLQRIATPLSASAYEAARIEAGWPRWGIDMGTDDLPVEAGFEPIAISYSKGCYLGQEVIQRLKTYGEAPWMLVSLEIAGDETPAAGSPVTAGGVDVGKVTSAARTKKPVAIARVKKSHKAPGTPVETDGLKAVVRELIWRR